MKKFLLLFAILGLLAARSSAEKIDLGGGKILLLTLPDTWAAAEASTLPPGMAELGTTVRYITKSGSNDAVLINILTVPDDHFANEDRLKAVIEQATEKYAAGSVEGKADLKDFKLGGVTGFCATFTDANLVGKPSIEGDYKAMTSCFVFLGDRVMVMATVFTDDVAGKAYAEGMRLLKSISLELPKNTI